MSYELIKKQHDFANEVLLPHQEFLENFAYRLCKNTADAEDLVQDTNIRALQNMDSFRGESKARTWLHSIMHNRFLDRLRSAEGRRRASDDPAIYALENATVAPEQFRVVQSHMLGTTIYNAMGTLSPEEKTAFLLKHQQGMSYREIAATLDINVGSVKSLIHRAKVGLQANTVLAEQWGPKDREATKSSARTQEPSRGVEVLAS